MRVVITGASRGIGRATALKLAADGAEALTLCDIAYLDELEALATNLRTSGCKVKTVRADMARPKEPARVIATAVKAMGGIDAIVGNAGITAPGKLADLDVETWDRVFNIDLRANWLLAKAAYPYLKKSRGSIVMLASMAGIVPQLPHGLRRVLEQKRPFEFRPTQPPSFLRRENASPQRSVWFRSVARLPDEEALHRCLLAYVSDFYLLDTALMPHGMLMPLENLVMASIDHAMWFHRNVRVDDWLLYSTDSPSAGGARGFARGSLFSRDGRLVASTSQEGLIRLGAP